MNPTEIPAGQFDVVSVSDLAALDPQARDSAVFGLLENGGDLLLGTPGSRVDGRIALDERVYLSKPLGETITTRADYKNGAVAASYIAGQVDVLYDGELQLS